MKLFFGHDGHPLFSSKRVAVNFIVLVLCSQFAFSVLAMKGALLPQMLELWQISKTQFGLLMSIYGIVHNVFYVALAWAQDRFFTAGADPSEYGIRRRNNIFSGSDQRLRDSVLFVRDVVVMV